MDDHCSPTPRRALVARQPEDRRRLLQHHQDQARMAQLETALSGCLHYIAALNGVPCDTPEPECSIDAKRLLGWRLG